VADSGGPRTSRAGAPRRPHGEDTIEVVLRGRFAAADIPGLWGRLLPLLGRTAAPVVVCDVTAMVDPDAATIDALARLQLTARRYGCCIRLRHACGPLQELLSLTGLAEVVPCAPDRPLQPGGEAEQREPTRGIEEERDPADPSI
jgi:ABC-type transporter Mla MlaB component